MVSCHLASSLIHGWIIDSDDSDHMTCDLSKFIDPKVAADLPRITLHTGDSTSISHTGNVNLCNSLTLQNVLCVPKVRYNLQSVPKLIKDSRYEVNFFGTHCVIRDDVSKKIRGVGKARNGLYYLVDKPLIGDKDVVTCLAANHNAAVPFAIWHHRLGHASLGKLQHIPCVKNTIKKNNQICITCPMAKFTNLPYQLSESHADKPFELIHMDIRGPYKVCTREK
uniref:GAG-pre-integrase domain-containing protein n=1 Tax=Chenopodium quinoa TaxID=63459 RepID=A0A803MUI4_CHEQI